MRRTLAIYVECEEGDFQWLRDKCVPAVENTVDEQEERLDGEATVYWEEKE